MRTAPTTDRRRRRPPNSPALDPYVVQGTWTREELLRARGVVARQQRDDERRTHAKAA